MPVDKSIPKDDPCSNAGDRIRELIRGEGKPPEGDEKLALAAVCLGGPRCFFKEPTWRFETGGDPTAELPREKPLVGSRGSVSAT